MELLALLLIILALIVICAYLLLPYKELKKVNFLDQLIHSGQIPLKACELLSLETQHALNTPYVRKCLEQQRLSMQEVIDISHHAQKAFTNPLIQEALDQESITFGHVLDISFAAEKAASDPYIQSLLTQGHLSINQVLLFELIQYNILTNPFVTSLLDNHFDRLPTFLAVGVYGEKALSLTFVQELLTLETLNIDDLPDIDEFFYAACTNPAIKKQIINGERPITSLLKTKQPNNDQQQPESPSPLKAISDFFEQLNIDNEEEADKQSTHPMLIDFL